MEQKHLLILTLVILISGIVIFQDLLFSVSENENKESQVICYESRVGERCHLYDKSDNSSNIENENPPPLERRGAELIDPKNQKPKDEPIIKAPKNISKPELIEEQFVNINTQKFLLHRIFIVSELTEDDFIGLYDLLKTNELILFIFDSTETHQYFNDHVPTGTDVIWINDENTIINFASVPYCKDADKLSFQEIQAKCTIISSEGKYLLETHNGFINEHKIKIGSKTEIHLLNS